MLQDGGIPTKLVDSLTFNRTVGNDGSVTFVTIIEGKLSRALSGFCCPALENPTQKQAHVSY